MKEMAFWIPQPCIHCGDIQKLLVRSDLDGRVRVALTHNEWETPQWHDVKGFENLVRIDEPKGL